MRAKPQTASPGAKVGSASRPNRESQAEAEAKRAFKQGAPGVARSNGTSGGTNAPLSATSMISRRRDHHASPFGVEAPANAACSRGAKESEHIAPWRRRNITVHPCQHQRKEIAISDNPTVTQDVVYTFERTGGVEVRAYFQPYKGPELAHTRLFRTNAAGEKRPGRGIAVEVQCRPELLAAAAALHAARARGVPCEENPTVRTRQGDLPF